MDLLAYARKTRGKHNRSDNKRDQARSSEVILKMPYQIQTRGAHLASRFQGMEFEEARDNGCNIATE